MDDREFVAEPFMVPYSQGQDNGRIDGKETGYRDGYALGRTTAIHYGFELGYTQGFLKELELSFSRQATSGDLGFHNRSRMDRIERSVDNLKLALNEFPTASEMVSSNTGEISILDDVPVEATQSNVMDVDAKMQCIRARFKLLCLQIDPQAKLQLSAILCEALVNSSELPVGDSSTLVENHLKNLSW